MSQPTFFAINLASVVPPSIRRIEAEYHVRSIAQSSEQLVQFNAASLKLQSQMAAANTSSLAAVTRGHRASHSDINRIAGGLRDIAGDTAQMANRVDRVASGVDAVNAELHSVNAGINSLNAGLDSLNAGIDSVNRGIDELNYTSGMILDAINQMSYTLAEHLQEISLRMLRQQQTLEEISQSLHKPYETKTLELRKEADRWLKEGMRTTERDRQENWQDAMRLLRITSDNPIGMQDYVVWFQIGWLLWKHDEKIDEAADAFYRAQRLSAPSQDLYYLNSLRHLAHMLYLQGKFDDAYQRIKKAIEISRDNATFHDNLHETLFEGARYASKTGHDQEVYQWLSQCIDLQPTTIVTMFAEEDFQK